MVSDSRHYVPGSATAWAAVSRTREPMSGDLHVTCPKCGYTGHVPLKFAGHLIHCKHCDQHFPVPELRTAPASAAPVAAAAVAAASGSALGAALPDDIPLAPLSDDEEKHCRERYEARVLSKNRNEHHEHDHD